MIESNWIYIESDGRTSGAGIVTPENMEPNPKHPIMDGFFRSIVHSDQPGYGVLNLYKSARFYFWQEPCLIEGGLFRIIVSLGILSGMSL